jgi:CelD/BcsL family acetyltransferase involved in cellulose biosynthesis
VTETVRIAGFDETQGEWEELLPRSPSNTIFVTPTWQRVWWECFGGESDPQIISLYDDGEALGIAPLISRNDTISFLGDTDLFDYHDFIVPAGREAAFHAALWDQLERMEWRTVELTSLRQDSPTLQHLPALAKARGHSVEVAEEDMSPVAALPPTWEEYVAGLPKKHRHELRRKLRKLEAAGEVRQYVLDTPEEVGENIGDFFRLHRASSPDKAEFMTGRRERFFRRIGAEFSARGQFRLELMELGGTVVASCINFDYLDSYLLYNSGYDPAYSNLSVGILNKALSIKEAIGAGKRFFDFLRGTERYKYNLGAEDRAVYRLTVRRQP